MTTERVVIAATTAYYGQRGRGHGEWLRPVIDVIDRAAPGIVELSSVSGGPGFDVRLAERPFPAPYANELRQAAAAALGQELAAAPAPVERAGWLGRMAGALRRLFSA
jgi:hypothetical protein